MTGAAPGLWVAAEAACPLCIMLGCGKRTLHVAPQALRPQVAVEGTLRAASGVSEPGLSVLPQAARRKGCLKLWSGCTEPGGVLACSATTLLDQLKKTVLHRVRGKYPGQLETGSFPLPAPPEALCRASGAFGVVTVRLTLALASPLPRCLRGTEWRPVFFSMTTSSQGVTPRCPLTAFSCVLPACRRLLEQVVSCGGLLPGAGLLEEQTVTWFQFHSYLQRHSVSDLERHFAQLTKEGRGRGGQRAASKPHSSKGASVRGALCPHAWKPVSQHQSPLQLFFGKPDLDSSM